MAKKKATKRSTPKTRKPKRKAADKAADFVADLEQQVADQTVESDARVKLLNKEKQRLLKRLADAQARSGIIVEQVRDILSEKNIIVNIPPTPPADRSKTKHVEIPVLCVGDIHMGYYYPNGEHAYNVDIARDRMMRMADIFLARVRDRRTSAKIEELRLYLMGDIVEGENMRQGHAHHIEGPLIQQALDWAPNALTALLVRFLEHFRKIHVVAVPGNHGRNGPPRTDSHPSTNWDRVVYQVTRMMVENAILHQGSNRTGAITWNLPSDRTERTSGDDWYAIDYVFDWCNCILHGEDLRGKGWGGIPFYGVERMVRRYADVVDDPLDFMFMGHIHTDAKIPSNYREVFVNGAIESSSTYARKQLVSATIPSQSAVFYTEANGPIGRETLHLVDRVPQGVRTVRAIKRREA